MYIGLSTFPQEKSGNVGDQLITEAAIQLFKKEKKDFQIEVLYRGEDLTSRLHRINNAEAIILFGFPVRTKKIIPKVYKLTENLDFIKPPIIPLGASYNFFPGYKQLLKYENINDDAKRFIDYIVPNCPNNEISVRTKWVGELLNNHGYKTILTGDPAWYDLDFIGTKFHKPHNINQLVFTPPHNELYFSQAKALLKKLTNMFPDAKKIISFHSALTTLDKKIRDVGILENWKIKYTSHETINIEFYKESDLHVGYRKHGHLAHLRWRIPSIVLAEDSRSMGLIDTFETGGFPAYISKIPLNLIPKFRKIYQNKLYRTMEIFLINTPFKRIFPIGMQKYARANPKAVSLVEEFIYNQLKNNWEAFDKIEKQIDDTYYNGMKPYIQNILKNKI